MPDSPHYHRLLKLAIALMAVAILLMVQKSFRSSHPSYQPALWSCSVVGSIE